MMQSKTTVILALAVAALAGCTGGDRFGFAGNGGAGAGVAAPGFVAGGPEDPASAAFFSAQVGDRVLFDVDQSTLGDVARQTLTQQVAWLTENDGFDIVIEGHADEQGTREYNLGLGARRAAAVQEFMVSQGLPPGRILRTTSFGKERPIEICSEEACYAQNRRAVTVLSAGATFATGGVASGDPSVGAPVRAGL